jgi:hypothetical protein
MDFWVGDDRTSRPLGRLSPRVPAGGGSPEKAKARWAGGGRAARQGEGREAENAGRAGRRQYKKQSGQRSGV